MAGTRINDVNTGHPGVVQLVRTNITALTGCNTRVPAFDASIVASLDYLPQITDGDQILTATITPKFASSNIFIEVHTNANHAGYPTYFGIVSLFNTASTNSLASNVALVGEFANMVLLHQEAAASTAARTYTVRIGPSLSQTTMYINGLSGLPFYGGTMECTLTVYEIGT